MFHRIKKKRTGKSKAWVISVFMGLGHVRAAYPLKDIAYKEILLSGTKSTSSQDEFKIWMKLKRIYYFFSKAENIPIIGKYIYDLLIKSEEISPYYPKRDLSSPNWASAYLDSLIYKKNLCGDLIKRVESENIPVISTYFASAIAIDRKKKNIDNNYCVICDSDINRVWVPVVPRRSNIKYLVPSNHAKRRLTLYGIDERNIIFTGFPLPKENIGSEKKQEILKKDVFNRLLRLDPENKFFSMRKYSVLKHLNIKNVPLKRPDQFTLMFAVGGAGAQFDMAKKIVEVLKTKIRQNNIRFFLSAGIRKDVNDEFLAHIDELGLSSFLNKGIRVIYSEDVFSYLKSFNDALHETDVLWTKPSELSFYAGLGIPILIAPPIGTHEMYNRKWLRDINAGVVPDGPVKYCDEWLFHIREEGRLAEAAWNGFLKAPSLGTYNIENLIS
ncbi:MAG: hypothetical protein KKH98_10630 [Spirochaetes bacterium]|nr:hypothetical protein [Spirochaetota bacterium]